MNKYLFLPFIFLTIHISSAQNSFQDSYGDGYKSGWKAGYCYQDNFCSAPLAPIAPLAGIGQSSFQDGYNRGFSDGRERRLSEDNNQTQTNNKLIEGVGNAYGNGLTIDGTPGYDKYNANNNYGIPPRQSPRQSSSYRGGSYVSESDYNRLLRSYNLLLENFQSLKRDYDRLKRLQEKPIKKSESLFKPNQSVYPVEPGFFYKTRDVMGGHYKVLKVYDKLTIVDGYLIDDYYYKVKHNGIVGYVHKKTIEK